MDKEIPKHRKKAPDRKRFTVQCRFRVMSGGWGGWHTWSRHMREADRDKALETLQTKVDFGVYGKKCVEFRRGE